MAGPGHDLQVGQQGRIVQGGRHLAHAAAIGGHGLAAHIGGADLKSSLLGGGAHGIVIAEVLAAVDHGAADVPGSLADVENPVAGAGDIGGVLSQHVPEQHLLQLRLGDGGIGDLGGDDDLLAGLGVSHQLFGPGHVEGDAYAPLHHLAGGPVIGGVLSLAADLLLQGRQVQGLALGDGADAGDGVHAPGGHRLVQGPGQLIPVDGAAVGGLGDVEAVALALLHAVRPVHRVKAQLPAEALRPPGQLPGVQVPLNLRLGVPEPAADQVIAVDEEIAAVGRVPGGLGRLLDGFLAAGGVALPLPFVPDLLRRKAAHVHPQHPGAPQGGPSGGGRRADGYVRRRQHAHGDAGNQARSAARGPGLLFLL